MFIAVVMQLRGFACGVILTTQMSSIVPPVLVFAGFASALLLSKPGAPITFSSTNRYLSILPARKMSLRVEVIRWLGAALNRTTRLPTYRATCSKVGGWRQQMVFDSDIWLKKDLATGSGLPHFDV